MAVFFFGHHLEPGRQQRSKASLDTSQIPGIEVIGRRLIKFNTKDTYFNLVGQNGFNGLIFSAFNI